MTSYFRTAIQPARRGLLFILALLMFLPSVQLAAQAVATAEANSWADGAFPVLEVGGETDSSPAPTCSMTDFPYMTYAPEHWYSSADVLRETSERVCATTHPLGQFGYSSSTMPTSTQYYDYVKPNSKYAYKVLSPDGRRSSIVPVPGQKSFIRQYNHSFVTGAKAIQIGSSLGAAGEFGLHNLGSPYTYREFAYKLTTLPPAITYPSGEVVFARYHQAFSNNGEWMVFETGYGIVRLNLQTKKMALISKDRGSYDLGFMPDMQLAISDDGNAVVKSGFVGSGAVTTVFDLSACQDVPIVTSQVTAGCRSRVVESDLAAQKPGFQSLTDMRFNSDGKSIGGKVAYSDAGVRKFADMTYSVAGYVRPTTEYLAMGDSFSSGEGANFYVYGTNHVRPLNKCHLSESSYPHLAANKLGINNFHNVACSGATMEQYYYEDSGLKVEDSPLGDWQPGIQPQGKFLKDSDNPRAITISMGGNDIGFSNIIKDCIFISDTCMETKSSREALARNILDKTTKLSNLYSEIKNIAPSANVYVVGYPQIVADQDHCAGNVRLNKAERQTSRLLVAHLNASIRAAAQQAGVNFVDVGDTFGAYALCGASAQKAVNGLTFGNDQITKLGPVGNESYHPTAFGYQLMADALIDQSNSLTKGNPSPQLVGIPYKGTTTYDNFVNSAPFADSVYELGQYDEMDGLEIIYKSDGFTPRISSTQLKTGSLANAVIYSTPTQLGSLSVDSAGNLVGNLTIPDSVAPGMHTLHITGMNIAGEYVELKKVIYVAQSGDDIDGDGIVNTDEKCLIGEASNQDVDKDSIDDACDGVIGEAPVDNVAPVVTGTASRNPDNNDWYNNDVTIGWTAIDADSDNAPNQPADTRAAIEGSQTYTSDASCDAAGNCATGSVVIKLDKSLPSISYSTDREPNSAGWYSGPVTISFQCDDEISGIEDCSAEQTISGSGIHIVSGQSKDSAGNTNHVGVTIRIDDEAPVLLDTSWFDGPKATTQTTFVDIEIGDNLSAVTEAEYFLGDIDPGRGNGAAMAVEDSRAQAIFGTDYPAGVYKVTVRVKDAAGNWSANYTDYLVVYNPFGSRATGHTALKPSLVGGDRLPGLLDDTQDDLAKIAFNVRYDDAGSMHKNSDFQLQYVTGANCNKPALAVNCHKTSINATNVDWLVIHGASGEFQARAAMAIDGSEVPVILRVSASECGKHSQQVDTIRIRIFAATADPHRSLPLYQLNAELTHGTVNVTD